MEHRCQCCLNFGKVSEEHTNVTAYLRSFHTLALKSLCQPPVLVFPIRNFIFDLTDTPFQIVLPHVRILHVPRQTVHLLLQTFDLFQCVVFTESVSLGGCHMRLTSLQQNFLFVFQFRYSRFRLRQFSLMG